MRIPHFSIHSPRLAALLRSNRRHIIALVLLGLTVYLLLPQVGELKTALRAAAHANLLWLTASLVASALTYICSLYVFRAAAPDSGSFRPLLLLQIASSFANRFTPAGLGSVALSIRYLQKCGSNITAASTVSAIIRLAGLFSGLLFLPILFVYARQVPMHLVSPPKGVPLLLGILGILILSGIIVAIPRLRKRVGSITHQVIASLRAIRGWRQIVPLVAWSLALTLAYGFCLYFALLGVGVRMDFLHVLLVFVIGTVVGNAAPTPGSIGGIEAALVSGLAVFGAPTEPAIAGVLIYRILSFWLPILPGYVAFRVLRKENYI
jgi:undecaprenyl-diphosphatase